MSRSALWILAAFSVIWLFGRNIMAETLDRSSSQGACTRGETWTFSPALPPEWALAYRNYLSGKKKAVSAFADGLALRRAAQTDQGRFFGEYWIARSLIEAKLPHIAVGGMTALATRPVRTETSGIQLAAIACILNLRRDYPSMSFPESLDLKLLTAYSKLDGLAPADRDTLSQAEFALFDKELNNLRYPPASLQALTTLLQAGAPAYVALARGLLAEKSRRFDTAETELQRFLDLPDTPSPLQRYRETAEILLGHAQYSKGGYALAAKTLRAVSKSSNRIAENLTALSWSYLMDERYPEAIGAAMSLQSGGLRKTFAPEAPMVMAMALNELCQFPQSLKEIEDFRKEYEPSYTWLKANSGNRTLYALAIRYLGKKETSVPDRVAGEWLRSPVFLADQSEINLLFDEGESTLALGRMGSSEQKRLAGEILALARDLKPRIRIAKMKLREGETLPPKIQEDLAVLKDRVTAFNRLRQAAPVWQAILGHARTQMKATESRLMSEINTELSGRSDQMLVALEEVSENVQMIEVEIYSGASQDIVWRNAHPDYAKMLALIKDPTQEAASKVWNWGRAPAAFSNTKAEVWEDELGSMQAGNLTDHCASKDRYMALKKRGQGSI